MKIVADLLRNQSPESLNTTNDDTVKMRPTVPPKPNMVLSPNQKIPLKYSQTTCCKCVANQNKYEDKDQSNEYNLSIRSTTTSASSSSSAHIDAYNLLDEIYAEIEDNKNNPNTSDKTTFTYPPDDFANSLNNSDNSNSSVSTSSSGSTYSCKSLSTKKLESPKALAPPPPLPAQPPPQFIKTRSHTQLTSMCEPKRCNADDEPNETEQSYLEPSMLDKINSDIEANTQSSNKRRSLAAYDLQRPDESNNSVQEKLTKRTSSIFKTTNNRLAHTLKLIRNKSFLTNGSHHASYSLETTEHNSSSTTKTKTVRPSSSILLNKISEPKLISQTYDFNKTNLIMLLDKTANRLADPDDAIQVQVSSDDNQSGHPSAHQNGILHSSIYLY
jgi:hypothetical protein